MVKEKRQRAVESGEAMFRSVNSIDLAMLHVASARAKGSDSDSMRISQQEGGEDVVKAAHGVSSTDCDDGVGAGKR